MRRVLLLVVIFTVAVLTVVGVTNWLLYRTALRQEASRLGEIARSQARVIESMARHEERFDRFMPDSAGHGSPLAAILAQLSDAHARFGGFGRTGEFTLGRREGDRIVYLLSHRQSGLDSFKVIPFNGRAGEPMRRALSGRSGTVIGPDYRSVRVLAAYEPVAAYGMGVVAKIDMAEVNAPFVQSSFVGIALALITVLAGSLLFYRITNPVLRALASNEERLRKLYGSMSEGLALHEVVYDASGKATDYRILDVNPAYETITGISRDKAIGRLASELYGTGSPPYLDTYAPVAETGKPVEFETEFVPMAKSFHISVFSPSRGVFATVFSDITARKSDESRIARLTRLYSVLSLVNEAIVRAPDEPALVERICTIVAEDGGFPLVWVGRVEGQEVRPVAVCGPDADYMKDVRVEVTGALGSGPTGTCIREDRTVVNDDFDTNAATAPWREPARRHGFRSSVALPLHRGGKAEGALTIYAREQGAFDDEQLKLLGSLCADVSYAFDALEAERRRLQTVEALRESRDEWERTFNTVPDLIAILDRQHRITRVNQAMADRLGVTPEQARGLRCYEVVHGASVPPEFCPHALTCADTKEHTAEIHEARLGGNFLVSTTPLCDQKGSLVGSVHVARDITELKQAEEALRESEATLRLAQQGASSGTWDWDVATGNIRWTPEMFAVLGLDPDKDTASFETWGRVLHPDDAAVASARIETALKEHTPLGSEYRIIRPDGKLRWIWATGEGKYDSSGAPVRMVGVCQDITGRKRAEDALRRNEATQRGILDATKESIWLFSTDGIVLLANTMALTRFGKAGPEVIGKSMEEILSPDLARSRRARLQEVAKSAQPVEFEDERAGIQFRHSFYPILDAAGRVVAVAGFSRDITESRRADQALRKTLEDLERSNSDLEQFAYAASHDLQQPLRMVASYVGLLSQRYRGQFDEKADRYIDYAVGGAKRMQALIDGLLHYSRVGTRGGAVAKLDTAAVVAEARANLSECVEECGAVIEIGALPEVVADRAQMVQLFQNLLSNAVKFHSAAPPAVSVSCRDAGECWEFAVRDNGIGIDPKYTERVFEVFKRLHTEQEYPGTGIGLALCRKIVERHGGRIWFEPAEGGGSVFRFTLPKRPAATCDEPAGATTMED